MATVILVRHGRTSANATGVLAGRSRGVRLDDTGHQQAGAVAERLAVVPLRRIVTSPLERTRQTAAALADHHDVPVESDRSLTEADYGEWTGAKLKELVKDKLWRQILQQPSTVTFPGGESMAQMSARVCTGVRRLDAAVEAQHGSSAVWAAVSHGDLIKAVLADALGLHLDLFQRISVDPASVSIVRYTAERPLVLGINTHAGDLSWLKTTRKRRSGPTLGGGAGPA
jgi:probable phosphomutase (TIGR03848 family)